MTGAAGAGRCVACDAPLRRSISKGEYRYFICDRCETAAMVPLPTDAEIVEHYRRKFETGNYELLRRFAPQYQRVYAGFVKTIEAAFAGDGRGLSGLRLLDVGCFTGEFLVLAAEAGCDVTGFELQREAVALAQDRLPGRVHQTDVHDTGIDSETYDAICLFGLIEHVKDPVGLLHRCRALLRPQGRLFLQTPDRGTLPARLMGRYWPPFSPIEHLHLFTRSSLTRVLRDTGFEVTVAYSHWKRLPVEYVFEMMRNFGPEMRSVLSPVYAMLPKSARGTAVPFYVGEMVIGAKASSSQAR